MIVLAHSIDWLNDHNNKFWCNLKLDEDQEILYDDSESLSKTILETNSLERERFGSIKIRKDVLQLKCSKFSTEEEREASIIINDTFHNPFELAYIINARPKDVYDKWYQDEEFREKLSQLGFDKYSLFKFIKDKIRG